MKRGVVNYITRNAWHPFGQQRLARSLHKVGFGGGIVLFNDSDLECPAHNEVPYAFKFYALKEAQKQGYELVLWVDAAFWAVREIDSLFDLIKEKGIVIQNSDCILGEWSTDISLNYFKMSREEAFSIMMYSGGFVGLDLTNNKALLFLNSMFEEAKKGIGFQGSWKNHNQEVSKHPRVRGHRHDMVVGTILAKRLGIDVMKNNSVFSYYGWHMENKDKIKEKVYFVCEGGTREI